MKTVSIDIDAYSDLPIPNAGIYRYCESPKFEILLFAYSADNAPTQVVNLFCGGKVPNEVIAALKNGSVWIPTDRRSSRTSVRPLPVIYSATPRFSALTSSVSPLRTGRK